MIIVKVFAPENTAHTITSGSSVNEYRTPRFARGTGTFPKAARSEIRSMPVKSWPGETDIASLG